MSKREIRLSVLELEKLGVTLAFPQYPDTKAEENSRRLAACWNACEGISTENLEDNKPIIELANDYNAALKQRDALRTALEEAIEYLEPRVEGGKVGVNLLPRLKAVIANVEGGAA